MSVERAHPKSAFIFGPDFCVAPDRVLLVVYFRTNELIEIWMPEHVTENMLDSFPDDVIAAIKDFLENVPRRVRGDGGPV